MHFLLPVSNHNREKGETFFLSNPANTFECFESNKYCLSARKKTEIVIKGLVIYGLTIDTISWIIYFFTFYPQKRIFYRSILFFLPFPTKNHISRLSDSGVWVQRWLILGRHVWVFPESLLLNRSKLGLMWHLEGLPFCLCILCASSDGILLLNMGRHMCPLKGMSSLSYNLVWISSLILHHNLSPVQNAHSDAKCECRLHAHIWQILTDIFNLGFYRLSPSTWFVRYCLVLKFYDSVGFICTFVKRCLQWIILPSMRKCYMHKVYY